MEVRMEMVGDANSDGAGAVNYEDGARGRVGHG